MAEEQKAVFGKYVVKGMLGEGGMGRVWRAYDPDLEVPVAIKELKEQFRDQANLERFYREAQIAAKCRHQNIVLITDLSKIPPYFVMEFLEARELSSYLHKGQPITLGRMVKILKQVCDGLGFLHGRGIFHRDLKPANIMLLKDDVVKITDFGISKAPFGQATMTQVIMGTIPYMSPEQITSPSKVDGRSDLWALGVIVYELTQRRHPFPGEGDINTIFHIVHSPPAQTGEMPEAIAPRLEALLNKALQKNPDERFRTTQEFKAALEALLVGIPDPESIQFPMTAPVFSGTVSLESTSSGYTILQDLGEKAKSLADQIDQIPEPKKLLLEESGVWKKAAEVARMARVLVEDRNPVALEAAIRDLESQKASIESSVARAVARHLSQAEDLLLDGQYEAAAASYRLILAGDPENVEARRGLERAQDGIERAELSAAAIARGRELAAQGDLEGAALELESAVGLKPDDTRAKQALSEIRSKLIRRQRAAGLLEQAREAIAGRSWETARSLLAQILEIDPADAEATSLLARAEEGAALVQRAEIVRGEAREHFEKERWDRARTAWRTVLDLVPGDAEAAGALAAVEEIEKEDRRRQALRPQREKVERALEALAAELDAARGAVEPALIGRVKDIVARARRATSSLDPKELDAALAEVERVRAEVRGAVEGAQAQVRARQKAEAVQARIAGDLDTLGAEVDAARDALDPSVVGRIRDIVVRARRAAGSGDLPTLEASVAEIESARGEVRQALKRAEEAARERERIAGVQDRVTQDLDALGEEVAAAREVVDGATLGTVKELAVRCRRAAESEDPKVLDAAIAEIAAMRETVRLAYRRAAEEAMKEIAPLVAVVKEIPKEDHAAIGGALVSRALQAVARAEAAHQRADAAAVAAESGPIAEAVEEIRRQRDAAIAKGAAAIKEASAALEGALKANAPSLKEATARAARDAVARAARDASGHRIHVLQGHVDALRAAREGILREVQETLRALREAVTTSRGGLEAKAKLNRRAVARKADLSKRIDGLLRESASPSQVESLERLERLVKDLDAATAAVPFDPLRYLPHAIGAAVLLAAAGGFLAWRYVQSSTAHDYALSTIPWARIVSIEASSGGSVEAPPGESPFHHLRLLPGTYAITVENPTTGAKETVTANIPADRSGSVKLAAPDYKRGLQGLMNADPYFKP